MYAIKIILSHLTGVPSSPGRPLVNSFTSRSVNLSWTPPGRDGHSPVQRYLVQKREGEDARWEDEQGAATYHARTDDNSTTYQVY